MSVAVTARGLVDYRGIFALEDLRLGGARVLDCAAGASSFAAEATGCGAVVTAVDVAYDQEDAFLRDRVERNLEGAGEWLSSRASIVNWPVLGSIDQYRIRSRLHFERFFKDRQVNRDRYVAAALPNLPFGSQAFDLAVCSNFLFAYPELGVDFHLKSLLELARVAAEVRVHPLIDREGKDLAYLDQLLGRAEDSGLRAETIVVTGSWMIPADHTLVLRR